MNEDNENNEWRKMNRRLRGGCLFVIVTAIIILYAVLDASMRTGQ